MNTIDATRDRQRPGPNLKRIMVPFAPLYRQLVLQVLDRTERYGIDQGQDRQTADGVTDVEIGEILGVPRRTVRRWRTAGELPLGAADVAAQRAGLNTMMLWPDEYFTGIEL